MLCDGQFGSTGKGLIAAWLANNATPMPVTVATTNAGAQAGHTTKRNLESQYVCYHLPTIGVERKEAICYINSGSIIAPDLLYREMDACGVGIDRVRIGPRASVITAEDAAQEKATGSSVAFLGSTQKGVGAALARKVCRSAVLAKDDTMLASLVSGMDLNRVLSTGAVVTVEVPQGLGLSLNHGYQYPYCTSRDCWVGQGLSDAGIHPSYLGDVCMVVRSYPIRVGSINNATGMGQPGYSGDFYPDSTELMWEKDFPWLAPERTTVTQRVRRIATWSAQQYMYGLTMNRPSIVALTFCDYFRSATQFLDHYGDMLEAENAVSINPRHIFSVGPCLQDVTANYKDVATYLHNRMSTAV